MVHGRSMSKPDRPLIIAHRGDSAHAPENTLAAFRGARLAGAEWIELDVQATADGALICLHDLTLDRTTDAGQMFPGRPAGAFSRALGGGKPVDAGSRGCGAQRGA